MLLQVTWFVLIGVLFAGYAVLDGAAMPVVSQREDQRERAAPAAARLHAH